MKLSDYRFELPTNLIALNPAANRDEARMMVVHRKTGIIEHKTFKDILEYFGDGDVIVVNDTKVFPARLYGNKEKTGADIEVFLLRELSKQAHLWDVLVDPARKIRVGNKLYFGEGDLVAEVIDNTTNRGRTIRFLWDGEEDEFYKTIYRLGETPLPKVITKRRKVEKVDAERFQTIFAQDNKIGAVSAPMSGLHFTKPLVKRLALKGVEVTPLTYYISLGTFKTVEVEDLTKHKPDSEQFQIPDKTVEFVNKALDENKRICAVGSSVMRSLESSVSANGRLKPADSWTDKFIFLPYDFKIPNTYITNFHLPESTLYMTACAFAGFDLMKKAYDIAIQEEYKFFSYGDAMLIL
jgi:S-adenosylmethionine:tRNA ribosyltransferase-isomerase